MTLLGALCLQYLGIVVCYKCYLEIFLDCSLLSCRDNSVSVIMFIDDHLVSSITSIRYVIRVPQVQTVTVKLHFVAGAHFVVSNAAHTCTLYVWSQDRHASNTSKSSVIDIYLLTSWPHFDRKAQCSPLGGG